MPNNADNVLVAVTGGIYFDKTLELQPPEGTADDLSGWGDLGHISEEGIDLNMPGEGEKSPMKAWQNREVVRTLRTPPEDSPTIEFTCLETTLNTIEFAFGVSVTQGATEGEYTINTNRTRNYIPLVLDVIDGSELMRYYAPNAIVTGIGSTKLVGTEAVSYRLTVALDYDSTIEGQLKTWSTLLREETP
jgi:hypothetical protein